LILEFDGYDCLMVKIVIESDKKQSNNFNNQTILQRFEIWKLTIL